MPDSTFTPSPSVGLEAAATQAALEANWEEAITLNRQIVKADPLNLGAFNRLGRAYSEVGSLEKAKSAYREVLRRDPYNSIALKNLQRLKAANSKGTKLTGSTILDPNLFLEIPGKTKVLELTDLAAPDVLAALHSGDRVKLAGNAASVRVEDASGTKLGVYSGAVAGKLSNMIRSGCVFEAYAKSVKPQELRVFVREVKMTPRYAGSPTFPVTDNGFKPYVHESAILDNGPVITPDTDIEQRAEPTAEPEASEETPKKPANSVETLAEKEAEEIEED